MNPRVLELLKNPKNIQSEDLGLLKEEISSFPYIQNIRALHLYGVHLYDRENYQKELSITAAYTTDKKILYQLINGKVQQQPKPEIVEERKEDIAEPVQDVEALHSEEILIEDKKPSEKNQFEEAASLLAKPQPEIKHVYVNGERNRILFEGEENFLEDDNLETIDLESTLESGVIVTQKQEKTEEISQPEPVEESISEEQEEIKEEEQIDTFTPETIIEEEKISSMKEQREIEDEAALSFHETESFLPEVSVQSNTEEINNQKEEVNQIEGVAEFTPEKIIHEEEITSEEEIKSVRDNEELSFHGLESFLPEVTIQSNPSAEIPKQDTPRSTINKHEEEMRRLIEEVEKKMKAKKETSSEKEVAEPEIQSHDINFAETQSFEVVSEQKDEIKAEVKEPQPTETEIKPEVSQNEKPAVEESQPATEVKEETKTAWKPMSFESNVPDSLINKPKPIEVAEQKTEAVIESPKVEKGLPSLENLPELVEDHSEKFEKNTEELKEDKEAPKITTEEKKQEEAPVMNVSFFSSNWAINEPQKEKKEEEIKEIPAQETKVSDVDDSNVPGFINTWQNWLKIDRSEEVEKSKVESKIKVIDSFIENNPKITQLKEESSFVVKEKGDDISHLMTETLAKLYFEQKLYTKAINAFQILANKHPEKKDYFEGKIQEIKDIRGKN
ncbi:hypothetical protein MUU74_05895 [Chryseobacterium daecheongense]|uniref:hypothetical protein n=1 Tax=Chryseobacterium daecheongense TaxID=192389 RepID=UPI001FD6B7A0|nr:hypothetical protein [Chryseobacterium daecheongense]UOU99489.1 hypothetical protein MUU74_05895 [Chryseobacterium daecheongense]